MSKGKFEIFKGTDSQFYFRLKAPNGEIIGWSEGYTMKQSAQTGIASVRVNSQYDSQYNFFTGSDGQHYFNLKSAGNNEIILRSEGYVSSQGVQKGAGAVKFYAPDATVEDLTVQNSYAY